ncbi:MULTISPECIES: TonB-dependent receptor [unclassified Massilia]|uniref:TonB-dependent receptor family protein n=1 Tax=unclassified Massilia TaxID=2609279 RepID=UPI0017834076|nr:MULTISPECIES: TonB-dependent receptor [unclassified Massilia]MBD8533374.1 TonB-dependent receptor [Massilia sp. CFBP 13647]MBD8676756.1 TonB-dependent receptor [Massilia sp. CFBP 13721]
MTQHAFRLNAIAALCACWPLAVLAAGQPANEPADEPTTTQQGPMNVVVVTGSRSEHASFDLPAAIDVIDASQIRDTQPRVNASEALAAVPGLVARDRQNYAQDLQISSRGFGARSAFGVRGVRLIADGIPATMPDGQGQAATFNLDMAERIEVLRGPFSALYGNHSGGVVQLFTRDPKGPPSIETSVSAGSYGMRKFDLNAQGESNGIGYLIDASRFDTDGFRDHGAARRDQAYAKLTMATSPTSRLVLTASGLRQDDTQDPLGVTWATYQRDPRAGEIDTTDTVTPQRTLAERYNTRKSIDHKQAGLTWEQRFGANRLQVTAYGGNRRVVQYQSFSRGFQAPPTHSGGVVDFDRDFLGLDVNWRDVRELAGGTLRTTVGIDSGRSTDARQGFENFVGTEFGVRGNLRRDEENKVSNIDPYLQAEWEREQWVVTAGLRHSRVKFDVADYYLSNGNDSGAVRYNHTTPLVGVLYKVSPTLNVYTSAARGFETPTLNEVFYSGSGAGFNFNLQPATSTHLEAGIKAFIGSNMRVNAALFQVKTQDELVVDVSSGGRTSYRNASATLRQGGELSLDADLGAGWSAKLALSALRAIYDEGFGTVPEGSRLPGVPRTSFYGELGWKEANGRYGAALETIANGRVFAEDTNTAQPAPGYGIVNLRAQAKQEWSGWTIKQFARLNNVFDKQYVGSVIVGDANRRFYEGAPGRNWVLGVSGQYQF